MQPMRCERLGNEEGWQIRRSRFPERSRDRIDTSLISKGLGILRTMSPADALAPINSSTFCTTPEKMTVQNFIKNVPASVYSEWPDVRKHST